MEAWATSNYDQLVRRERVFVDADHNISRFPMNCLVPILGPPTEVD